MADHTLTLTDDELGTINDALMVAPYHLAAPVINAINRQLQGERGLVDQNGRDPADLTRLPTSSADLQDHAPRT